MKNLEQKIRTLLREMGADIVGIGDVKGIAFNGYTRAIAVAKALPLHVLEREVPEGPTQEYQDRYDELNILLDKMADAVEELLVSEGHRSLALSRRNIQWDRETFSTPFPYKTAATRAGIGWVGKCALLVTPECGAGVRLTAILTDAPLETNEPINESRCGECTVCTDICPAKAIKNALWDTQKVRSDLVDIKQCDKIARDIAEIKLGERTTMCGKCFAACPYTKAYIARKKAEK